MPSARPSNDQALTRFKGSASIHKSARLLAELTLRPGEPAERGGLEISGSWLVLDAFGLLPDSGYYLHDFLTPARTGLPLAISSIASICQKPFAIESATRRTLARSFARTRAATTAFRASPFS